MKSAPSPGETFAAILGWIVGHPGLSQHRLAQLSGYGTDTISRLASGSRGPTEVQALRIGASLALDKDGLKLMNKLLESADFLPVPIPGEDVPDRSEYRPTGRPWSDAARAASLKTRNGPGEQAA